MGEIGEWNVLLDKRMNLSGNRFLKSIPDSVALQSIRTIDTKAMDTKQSRPIPNIIFRVLIIGRANSGKTTILQRVCDTTDSPTIYRRISGGERKKVRHGCCLAVQILSSYPVQIKLDPTTEVSDKRSCPLSPLTSELAW